MCLYDKLEPNNGAAILDKKERDMIADHLIKLIFES
jgi:hypothetical protein